jgi:hypothetical protein
MHDFATLVHTKKYGDVLIVDDFGDLKPTDAGHVYLYLACEEAIACMHLPRLCWEMVEPVYRSPIDPQEIEQLIEKLDRKGSGGQITSEYNRSKPETFAKLLRSEKFGLIAVIKDGDMTIPQPHVALQFRPTRPIGVRGFTIFKVKPHAELSPLGHDLALNRSLMRMAVDVKFQGVDLQTAETCIQSWLDTYPRNLPPVTFT